MNTELPHVTEEREHFEEKVALLEIESNALLPLSPNCIWSAQYNPMIHESSYGSIGLFHSKDSAIKCIIASMREELEKWIRLYGDGKYWQKYWNTGNGADNHFDDHMDWFVESMEIKP